MNFDPADFVTAYQLHQCRPRSPPPSSFISSTLCSHFLVILTSVSICAAGFYYHKMQFEINDIRNESFLKYSSEHNLSALKQQIEALKKENKELNEWRNNFTDLFPAIYLRHRGMFDKMIEQALEIYDADKVGLFDFASVYAGGSIIATPYTKPFAVNQTMIFFSLLNLNMKSNPELLIQPANFPGNCFAFYGNQGRILIKLGKSIHIKAVTMEHLKYTDDSTSAPKDFEVYGIPNVEEGVGVLLGRFKYILEGRTYQTFEVDSSITNDTFGNVELHVLNNHGKREYTCVYRFRVHNMFRPNKKFSKTLDNDENNTN